MKDAVRIILDDGAGTVVPLAEYTKEVLRFVESIEAYYRTGAPKHQPRDEVDREGWRLFWSEWRRRKSGAEAVLRAAQPADMN